MTDNTASIPDSEAGFAASAGRRLAGYGLVAVFGVVVLMFALQGLASLVGSSTEAARAIDRDKNSITIAMTQEPPQLNSTLATDSQSGIVLGHTMEGLTRMNMHDELEPGIAERWEVTDTRATFWLRKDAKWSDGVPITAHDFVFAWRTVLDPDVVSEYAFLLYPIKNGRAVNERELPLADLGVRALDDHTLEVDLQRPVPFFAKMVAFQTYLPVREDFYRSTNGRFGADAWELLYSGPYKMTSWVHGSSLLMERNEHYWDKSRALLDKINVAYITEDATATLNFFKDYKIAYTTLSAENLNEALRQRWNISHMQDGTVFFLDFNHRPERPTRNWHLRRAMQLSLDMNELVYKVTKIPGYSPGDTLFPRFLKGVTESFRGEYPPPQLKIDYQQARRELALAKQELGIQDFPPIVLLSGDTPTANIQGEWVQAELKQHLGLDVRIDRQIFKQRLAKMTAGDFDLVMAGWGPDYDDPLTFGDLYASWNLNNRGRYNNPQMDQLIEFAQSTSDAKTRMDTFGQIQQLLFDDVVMLPMYERGVPYVVHDGLHNVKRRVIGPEVDFTYAYIE